MRNTKPILLVEDNAVDATAIKRALKDLGAAKSLVHTTNGEEALDYLRSEDNEQPCIILLDLNMPKMNGVDFLEVVKSDDVLKKIPVVVLTSSAEDYDVAETFRLSAAGYMVKPIDYERFADTIKAINQYWTLSELPANKG